MEEPIRHARQVNQKEKKHQIISRGIYPVSSYLTPPVVEIVFSKPFQGHNYCNSWKIGLIGVLKLIYVVTKERKAIAMLHSILHLVYLSVSVREKFSISRRGDNESVSRL